jgi:hypothetical protein
MTSYLFKTSEFGVSDEGMHLLRNGFNYQTISWSDINWVKIERGKELHNWVVIFLFGVVVLAVGVFVSFQIIHTLINNDIALRNAKLIWLLFIPVAGAYFVFYSLQTGIILKINYALDKNDMFPLKQIVKDGKLNEFDLYWLGEKTHIKQFSVINN